MQNKLWLILGYTVLSTSIYGLSIDEFRRAYIAPSTTVHRSSLISAFNQLSPLNQRLANAMIISKFNRDISQLRKEELIAQKAGTFSLRRTPHTPQKPQPAPSQPTPSQPTPSQPTPSQPTPSQPTSSKPASPVVKTKKHKHSSKIASLQKTAARKAALAKKRAGARKKARAYRALQRVKLKKAQATACKIARQLRAARKERHAQRKAARIRAAQVLAAQQAAQLEAARKAQDAYQAQLRAAQDASVRATIIQQQELWDQEALQLSLDISKKNEIKKDLEQSLLDLRAHLAVGPKPDIVQLTNDTTTAQALYVQYQQAVGATEKSASDLDFQAKLMIQNPHIVRDEKEKARHHAAKALAEAHEARHDREAKAQELGQAQEEIEKLKKRVGEEEALGAETKGYLHAAENLRKEVQTVLAGLNALKNPVDIETKFKKLDTVRNELVNTIGKTIERIEGSKQIQKEAQAELRNALEGARKEIVIVDLSPLTKKVEELKAQQAELEKKAIEEAKQVVETVSRKVDDLNKQFAQFIRAQGKLVNLLSVVKIEPKKLEEDLTEYKKHIPTLQARIEDLSKDSAVKRLYEIEQNSELLARIKQIDKAIQPVQTNDLIHRAELKAKGQLLQIKEVPVVPTRDAVPGPVPPARPKPATQPQVAITIDVLNAPKFKVGSKELDANKPEEFTKQIENVGDEIIDAFAKELITATEKADKDNTRLSALFKLLNIYGQISTSPKAKEKMKRLMSPVLDAVTYKTDARFDAIRIQLNF